MNWKDYLAGMLAENSSQDFFHAFNWAVFAAILSLFYDVMRRDPHSTHSPVKFNWRFFVTDNAIRVVASLMTIIATLRFSEELIGVKPSAFAGFMIGLCLDRIVQRLKNIRATGKADKVEIPNQPTNNVSTENVCFPTIDPAVDVITKFNDEVLNEPMTASELVLNDSRFTLQQDDLGNPVLCTTKDTAAAWPAVTGSDFGPQSGEGFVGPRPARRRPRPI